VATILGIDVEPAVGVLLERALADLGHTAVLVPGIMPALQALATQAFDLIISEFRLPDGTALDLLDHLRTNEVEIPVIIMTGYASIEEAVISMRRGALDYLTKPLRSEGLRLAVNNALEVTRLRRQNEDFRREIVALRGERSIVGESRALSAALELVAQVAPTRATVLLEGESGTGKELFARAIHERSPRRDQPFVTVNCAALPEGLVESSLFGHERGAFTGAVARATGAFERAHHGTLLLDEISEMRLDLQAKLLRAIQEQEIERVGSHQPFKVDVRVVATTNRDLKAEVDAGRFRSDLYWRLHVFPIRTPSLRERPEDIPLLVSHFVKQVAGHLGIRPPDVAPETLARLRERPWSGNVRELANATERAVILCGGRRIEPELFGPAPPSAAPAASTVAVPNGSAAPATMLNLKDLEAEAIRSALLRTEGHRTRAAELLGISERTLRNKLTASPELAPKPSLSH